MPKVIYGDITFDSELEVEYWKYLTEHGEDNGIRAFFYHPKVPIQITKNNSYTPDFVIFYDAGIEIIETKGYNPYSKMKDDMIHQVMLAMPEEALREWIGKNFTAASFWAMFPVPLHEFRVRYKKIKYLKAYGFVDWDFKNPNTIANKRKEKINEQSIEIKDLSDFKKNAERYFRYHLKIVNNEKLTKVQREWYTNYVQWLRREYSK